MTYPPHGGGPSGPAGSQHPWPPVQPQPDDRKRQWCVLGGLAFVVVFIAVVAAVSLAGRAPSDSTSGDSRLTATNELGCGYQSRLDCGDRAVFQRLCGLDIRDYQSVTMVDVRDGKGTLFVQYGTYMRTQTVMDHGAGDTAFICDNIGKSLYVSSRQHARLFSPDLKLVELPVELR